MYSKHAVVELVKHYLEEAYLTYLDNLEKAHLEDLGGIRDEFLQKIHILLTVLDESKKMIESYEQEAGKRLYERLYSIVRNKPLNEIFDHARSLGVLQGINKYLSREKILGELKLLNYKQLYELFEAITNDDPDLKSAVFNEFLNHLEEIPCSEVFDYNGYLNKLEWSRRYSHTLEHFHEQALQQLLEKYADFIPEKRDPKTLNSFLYNISGNTYLHALVIYGTLGIREKIIVAIIQLFSKYEPAEISKYLTYKPYINLFEYFNGDQLLRFFSYLIDRAFANLRDVKYLSILNDMLHSSLYSKISFEYRSDLEKLCPQLQNLWNKAVEKLKTTDDFVEYIDIYMSLKQSMLDSWLRNFCKISLEELRASSWALRELMEKSVERGRTIEELKKSIKQLKEVDSYLSRELREELSRLRRKLKRIAKKRQQHMETGGTEHS